MKQKPVYKIMDEWGRVLIPSTMRKAAGLGCGDIIRLQIGPGGTLCAQKVQPIELGESSPEAVSTYVRAAITRMDRDELSKTAALLLEKLKTDDSDKVKWRS